MPGKIGELFVKYRQTIIQFVKFNFTGIANTLLDWGVFALMHSVLALPLYLAKTISFACGILNSFLLK